jgi:hypothetical protein
LQFRVRFKCNRFKWLAIPKAEFIQDFDSGFHHNGARSPKITHHRSACDIFNEQFLNLKFARTRPEGNYIER